MLQSNKRKINGQGDRGSIPGRAIPKTQKLYLIPPCLTLSNIRYVSRVKWRNPEKGVATSPTPWCSSYRKGSLQVTLNYGRQLYFYFYRPVHPLRSRRCPPGVMVKAMDCGIVVREFVLQSRYYVHFRINTLGKGMNPLILPAMG